jgi:hypothetical protein
MKVLFWIGLIMLILGLVSLVVPIARSEREGVTVGGVSLGVETRHEEKVSPAPSAVMMLGGLGAMAVGKVRCPLVIVKKEKPRPQGLTQAFPADACFQNSPPIISMRSSF